MQDFDYVQVMCQIQDSEKISVIMADTENEEQVNITNNWSN